MSVFVKGRSLFMLFICIVCGVVLCTACGNFNKTQKTEEKNYAKMQSQISLANRYLNDGLTEKAIDILEIILDKNQNSSDILQLLGDAYLRGNDNCLAAFHFERAAELDASKSICFLYAARANYADNEFKKAIEDYEQYLDVFENDYVAYMELSELHIQEKNIKQAYDIYKKIADNICEATEVNSDVLCKIACVFWRVKDLEHCKRILRELSDRNYDKVKVKICLLKVAIAEKDWIKVRELFVFFNDKIDLLEKEGLLVARNNFIKWGQNQKKIIQKINTVYFFEKISSWERESQQQSNSSSASVLSVAEGQSIPKKLPIKNLTRDISSEINNVRDFLFDVDHMQIPSTAEEDIIDGQKIENIKPSNIKNISQNYNEKSIVNNNIRASHEDESKEFTSKNEIFKEISKHEDSADYWYRGALYMAKNDDFKSAEMMILEAINRDQHNIVYYLEYIKIAKKTHNAHNYLNIILSVKNKFYDSPDITYELARCYDIVMLDRKNAIEKYREFLLICGKNHKYMSQVIKALERLNFK